MLESLFERLLEGSDSASVSFAGLTALGYDVETLIELASRYVVQPSVNCRFHVIAAELELEIRRNPDFVGAPLPAR